MAVEQGTIIDRRFVRNLANFGRVAFHGSRNPISEETLKAIETFKSASETLVLNPTENLLTEGFICKLIKHDSLNHGRASFYALDGKLTFSKGEFWQVVAAFNNQHNGPRHEHLLCPNLARTWVERVIERSEQTGEPQNLIDQLDVALEISSRPLMAMNIMHIGSRSIARNSDDCGRFEYLRFSGEEMTNWLHSICAFKAGKDAPGDNYHFWQNCIAGYISIAPWYRPRDIIFNTASYYLAKNLDTITDIARYKLFGHEGETHTVADNLGLNVGRSVANFILENTKSSKVPT